MSCDRFGANLAGRCCVAAPLWGDYLSTGMLRFRSVFADSTVIEWTPCRDKTDPVDHARRLGQLRRKLNTAGVSRAARHAPSRRPLSLRVHRLERGARRYPAGGAAVHRRPLPHPGSRRGKGREGRDRLRRAGGGSHRNGFPRSPASRMPVSIPRRTTVAELARWKAGLASQPPPEISCPSRRAAGRDPAHGEGRRRTRHHARSGAAGLPALRSHPGFLRPGLREIDVAAELEHQARLLGAEGMSFETIVASGPRSALPHGRATTARLPRRGFLTLDFGVILNGYCSDMTRTIHFGAPKPKERSAYESVLEAQQAAVAAVTRV